MFCNSEPDDDFCLMFLSRRFITPPKFNHGYIIAKFGFLSTGFIEAFGRFWEISETSGNSCQKGRRV